MSMEVLKEKSQILELYFFYSFSNFSRLRFPPPMSTGSILHRSNEDFHIVTLAKNSRCSCTDRDPKRMLCWGQRPRLSLTLSMSVRISLSLIYAVPEVGGIKPEKKYWNIFNQTVHTYLKLIWKMNLVHQNWHNLFSSYFIKKIFWTKNLNCSNGHIKRTY